MSTVDAFETSAHHQDARTIVLGLIRRGAPSLSLELDQQVLAKHSANTRLLRCPYAPAIGPKSNGLPKRWPCCAELIVAR